MPTSALIILLLVTFACVYLYLIFRVQLDWRTALERLVLIPYWPLMAALNWAWGRSQVTLQRLLAWILLLALTIRIPALNIPIWSDEAYTALVATGSFQQMLEGSLSDANPPLGFFIWWLWGQLAPLDVEWVLRIPSLFMGLLAVWLAYRLALALKFEENEALTAALLMAVLPAQIFYSAEARIYTLLTATLFASLWAVAADRPRWFALVGLTLPLTHAFGYLYLAGLGIGILLYWGWRWRWIITLAVMALLTAAYLPVMFQQSETMRSLNWVPQVSFTGTLFMVPSALTIYYLNIVGDVLVWFGFNIVIVMTLWRLRDWWRAPGGRLTAAVMLVPSILAVVVSLVWLIIYIPRALVPGFSLLVLPWAKLLFKTDANPRTVRQLTAVLAFLTVVTFHKVGVPRYPYSLCEAANVDSIYATQFNLGVLSAYNTDVPVYVWPGAEDGPFAYPVGYWPYVDLEARNFEDINGRFCLITSQGNESFPAEQTHLEQLPAGVPLLMESNANGDMDVILYER